MPRLIRQLFGNKQTPNPKSDAQLQAISTPVVASLASNPEFAFGDLKYFDGISVGQSILDSSRSIGFVDCRFGCDVLCRNGSQ